MKVDLCRHIKTNGLQCHGVQVESSVFCYFHKKLHNTHELYRNKVHFQSSQIMHRPFILQLPPIEDRESAQLAISCVINALATGCISAKEANSLFYGLQLASTNARGLRIVRKPTQMVRDIYQMPFITIPEASPDLAPPGRTFEIEDTPEQSDQPEQTATPAPTKQSATEPALSISAAAAVSNECPTAIARSPLLGKPRLQPWPSQAPPENRAFKAPEVTVPDLPRLFGASESPTCQSGRRTQLSRAAQRGLATQHRRRNSLLYHLADSPAPRIPSVPKLPQTPRISRHGFLGPVRQRAESGAIPLHRSKMHNSFSFRFGPCKVAHFHA
jgi:hypothetical protein